MRKRRWTWILLFIILAVSILGPSACREQVKRLKTKPKTTKKFGFIKRVYKTKGKNYLDLDYAEFLTGEEADRAAAEAGEIEPAEHVPNGYYIRNKNPKIRTLKLSKDIKIFLHTYNLQETGEIKKRSFGLTTFRKIFEKKDSKNEQLINVPYWIILEEKVVVEIEEQYIP